MSVVKFPYREWRPKYLGRPLNSLIVIHLPHLMKVLSSKSKKKRRPKFFEKQMNFR